MSNVSYWERRFVECFIDMNRRERYLSFLKGNKHRQKVLERLNHSLDIRRSLAEEISKEMRQVALILNLLRSQHVDETCYFMADGNELDGTELTLERGVSELLENFWGSVLICPPKPIAVYKEEGAGSVYLMHQR